MVLRAALLVFALALLAVLLSAARPASAQTDPPASGSWDVNDTTVWNRPVTLMGDLIVRSGGDLSLSDTTIDIWCYEKLEFGVKVEGGGRLTARNVVFQARNQSLPYKFVINWNAVVALDNCTITNVGAFGPTRDTWGVYVHSQFVNLTHCTITRCNVGVLVHGAASAVIFGCNISSNLDRGIWSMYASPFIANNRFENNSFGIFLEESPGVTLLNNDLGRNRRDAVALDANSSVAGWTVDEPVSWEGSTVLLRGDLTVLEGGSLAVRDSLLRIDSPPAARRTLRVGPGGSLRVENSTLEAAAGQGAGYALIVEAGGRLELEGSTVRGAGYDQLDPRLAGPYVNSPAWINGSDLAGCAFSLVLDNSVAHVSNSTLGGTRADAWLIGSTAYLANVRFNPSNVTYADASSKLLVGWHLSAGVVWQNGRAAAGASLTVKDGSGAVIFDGRPGPDGWVRRMELFQMELWGGGARSLSPVALLARRAGFPDIARQFQLDADREERLVFTDPSPPAVVIGSPQNGFGTNQSWVRMNGTASDDVGLERVELRLDDSPRWLPLPPGDWSFNLTNLSRGGHTVTVRAEDWAGQSTLASLALTVDFEPPRLELDEPFDESVLANATGVRFSGRTDSDAVLTIDGRPVPVDSAGAFDVVLDFTEGRHEVLVVAQDRGGNAVSARRSITVDLTAPPITVLSPVNNTRTRLDELPLAGTVEPGAKFRVDGSTVALAPDGSFNVTVLLSGGRKDIELYAEDRAGNSNTTIWTLDRIIDRPASGTSVQNFWLALALAAVVLVVAGAAAAFVVSRRKRRSPPSFASQVDAPRDR